MKTVWKLRKIVFCIPLILLFSHPATSHAWTYHNGSNPPVGPFLYAGTVKIYYQVLSSGADNWLDLTPPVGIQRRIVMSECMQGINCPLSSAIGVDVRASDTISTYFHGNNKEGNGWTEPTDQLSCGQPGKGDGKISYGPLQQQVVNNGEQIITTQCWDDSIGGDDDYNDVVLIYTYEHGTVVYPTPSPAFFAIKYLGIKLGKVSNPTIGVFQLPFCPVNIGLFNFRILLPCIIPWTK